jgi:EAL domain-containing protein (putative c-di-GMP-specific phosphodiesterase class I)
VELDCAFGQGFFFNKPVDGEVAEELISQML